VQASQKGVAPLEKKYKPFVMYPEAADTWKDGETLYENSIYAPVFRWREDYTNDFKARMDWCVDEYKKANHHPVAAFFDNKERTILVGEAEVGEKVTLDASKSTDPDGDDLSFNWSDYPEAGTYGKKVQVDEPQAAVTSLTIPEDASGKQIHIILKVSDNNEEVSLTSYRRIVINVN
jgi:hypothetical protein